MNDVCKKLKVPTLTLVLLTLLVIQDSYTNTAQAIIFNLSDVTIPIISIRVGSNTSISRVRFNVQGQDVGNGIPVDGNRT